MPKKYKKAGQPSKYPTLDKELIRKLYLKNFTDEEVADCLNINQETLHEYKKLYPEFSKSIKDWKIEADKKVEESLFHRAVGYSHDSEEIFIFNGKVIRAPTKKQYAPSEVACIFWLKNRHPDKWRDKPEEIAPEELINNQLAFPTVPQNGEGKERLKQYFN